MFVVRSSALRLARACAAATVLGAVLVPTAAAADDTTSGQTVVGQLVQAWPEHKSASEAAAQGDDGPLTWIEPAAGDAVRVPTDDLTAELGNPQDGVPVGATVQVVVGGEATDDTASAAALQPALDVLSAEVVAPAADEPPLGAAATDVVTVVMMIPAGGAAESGRTLAQIEDAVNGPVATYWDQQTDGLVHLTTAAGNDPNWVQATVDCSDPAGLWNQAAAAANWTRGTGKHLLVYLPRNSAGCAYGMAEVGSLAGGGRLYVTDVAPSVIAHELGHNFGLGHSSERQCTLGTETGSCRDVAYRDYYDVMGVSGPWMGSLNAAQSARLGVLPASQQVAVTSTTGSGSYTLSPYSGTSGVRAIKLTSPAGVDYWLEYRTATGQDSWLGTATNVYGLQEGVELRRATSGSDTSLLLDGTPSSSSAWAGDWSMALPVGNSVSVSGSDFTVTVTGQTAAGATVSVSSLGGDPQCLSRAQAASSGVALSTVDSALYAFGVGTDRQVWTRPVALSSGWQPLGGVSLYGPAAVTAGSTSYVFVIGGDGALYMRADSGYGWGGWTSLGGYLTSSPAAASLGDGQVRVFARGADNGLWSRELAGGTWSSWAYLGGVITAPPAATAYPAFGQIEVSVRGADSRLYTMGLSTGARSGAYLRRNFTACSAVAVPSVTNAPLPDDRVFLDAANGVREIDRSGTTHIHGGQFLSNPAVQYPGSSTVIAGTGGDRALWVYDTRPGGVGGWVSLGGQLI